MTDHCRQILDRMYATHDFQAKTVAECLDSIADDDPENTDDAFLLVCAEELRDWADYFIKQMTKV